MSHPGISAAVSSIADLQLTELVKGFPLDGRFGTVAELRAARPVIFDAGFSTPFAVLHAGAIRGNARKMAQYCAGQGVALAPHAKTTMAPQLFAEQLAQGAWGLTVATMWQASVCRRFGVQRLLLASELIEPSAVRWAAGELADPGFTLLSYADSPAQVERTAAVLAGLPPPRPLDVLIEVGYPGGRTGCRTTADIEEVAGALARSPQHRLAGVAGFEGFLGRDARPETLARVRGYLRSVRQAAEHLTRSGAAGDADPLILTAGGSAYFDIVTDELAGPLPDGRDVQVILRCGGYIAHEAGPYGDVSPFRRLPALAGLGGPLEQAAEVWASVLSRPEPELAILDAGKRDVGVDTGLPEPLRVRRGTAMDPAPPGWQVTAANDQHLYLAIGAADALAPGDLVSVGISHPCTTFDKWTWIAMVDSDYRVTDAIRTYF
jgi:D-serine deaminase-like pyridoxal phosphate-dependent protein